MTTVVAVKIGDTVHMGGDTRTNGNGNIFKTDHKIKQVGPFLVGGAGDTFPLDTILYKWTPPKPTIKDYEIPYEFFVKKVVPSVKSAIDTAGFVKANDNGFEFLFAFNGELYGIDDCWSVYLFIDHIGYVGTGGIAAASALSGGASIEDAMGIAEKYDMNTHRPFTFLTQIKER